jgi:hypothetical protein
MADTQTAPSMPQGPIAAEESIEAAHNAILGLLGSEEEEPKSEEEQPTEEDESTEEPDESLDEVSEDEDEDSEEESDEDEEESEESEEEEEGEEEPEVYIVKVDGADVEVSLDELVSGYSRQSDYTKKTQELSEQRKQLDAYAKQAQAQIEQTQMFRQQYVDAASQAIQNQYSQLQSLENTDWERLKLEDKEEYLTKRDDYREIQSNIQREQQGVQQAMHQQEQEQAHMMQQTLAEEHAKMVEIIPQWADPKIKAEIAGGLRDFALSKGFSSEEVSQLSDHRSVLVLLQAKAFEEMQSKTQNIKAKKTKNKPKLAKTGKVTDKKESSSRKRNAQMKRLKETGHLNDSVSLFEDFVEL